YRLQSRADHGLRKGVIPPALTDSCLLAGRRQRQKQIPPRQCLGEKVVLALGDFAKIRRKHAPERQKNLRNPVQQFARTDLRSMDRPSENDDGEQYRSIKTFAPSRPRRRFDKNIRYVPLLHRFRQCISSSTTFNSLTQC